MQAVSADALRKVFDNPNDFEDKKTRLRQYCESNLTNPRNNELFSRNLVFCYFDSFLINILFLNRYLTISKLAFSFPCSISFSLPIILKRLNKRYSTRVTVKNFVPLVLSFAII